jgi:hypothetical protein
MTVQPSAIYVGTWNDQVHLSLAQGVPKSKADFKVGVGGSEFVLSLSKAEAHNLLSQLIEELSLRSHVETWHA